MPTLSRPLDPRHGATVWIKVMQSPEYVDALKKAGLKYATPISVIGILDTGANVSALDSQVIRGMSLLHRGTAEVHTPSTGLGVEHRDRLRRVPRPGGGRVGPAGEHRGGDPVRFRQPRVLRPGRPGHPVPLRPHL